MGGEGLKKGAAMTTKILNSLLMVLFLSIHLHSQCTDTIPQIWVKKTLQDTVLSLDTIYHQGAPDSTRSTVVLRAWASSCSTQVGNPIDVLFACDLSGSMIGSNDPNPHQRITWIQLAARKFVDSLTQGYDKVAIVGWSADFHDQYREYNSSDPEYYYNHETDNTMFLSDTTRLNRTGRPVFLQRWFPLSTNLAGAKTFISESLYIDDNSAAYVTVGGIRYQRTRSISGSYGETPLNAATIVSLKYLAGHSTNQQRVLILLTDGEFDDLIGKSYSRAATQTYTKNFVDSIYHNAGIRTYAIMVGSSSMAFIDSLTARGGGKAYRASNGTSLDSIFKLISLQISDVAAVNLSPERPMIMDILGPGIHYYPGSYSARTSSGVQIQLQADSTTIPGRTTMKFMIDTVRVGKFLELRYDITAVMRKPDIFSDSLMRVNNTSGDDASNYSLVQYKNVKGVSIEKPLDKNWVLVKSSIGGLYISKSSAFLDLPSAARQISRTFTFTNPAVYGDTVMYALLLQRATDSLNYTPVNEAVWDFKPNSNWIAPILNNDRGSSKIMGITVPYNYHGSSILYIRDTVRNRVYRDSLRFVFSDASSAQHVTSIYIDADTSTPKEFTPRIVVIGNKTQLNSYRQPLFARSLTDRDSVRNCRATWSSSGFSIYASQFSSLFTGISTSKTIALTVRDTNFTQSDSGNIRIDSAGMSYTMRLVIIDTTDYDTTKILAIYNNNYGNNADLITNSYILQSPQLNFYPDLGDSLAFWSMMFDSNTTGLKYLGNKSASWQLNNGVAINSQTFVLSRTSALQYDRLIVTYTNEWSVVKRDTVEITWGFGKKRRLSIESQPGTYGATDSFPIASIAVPNNADTIRGIYAVIRDEYGFCIFPALGNINAVWAFNDPGALAYLDKPADSTSMGWIYRKASPATPLNYYLTAYGLPIDTSYQIDRDSVQIQLTNYSYTGLEIVTSQPIQGYSPGDIIPRNTEIRLRCDLSGKFQARALHGGNNYDAVVADWRVEPTNPFETGVFPFTGSEATLSPVKRTTYQHRLIAEYQNGGTTFIDTMLFIVEAPTVSNIVLDTIQGPGNGLNSIDFTGNLSQIKNHNFTLYANAQFTCSSEPGSLVSVNWNGTSAPNTPWFQNMIAVRDSSLYIDLNRIPNTPGSHSMNGTISIQYGSFTDYISINIHDTTDYDSLQFMVVDTNRHTGNAYPYSSIQELMDRRQLTYTFQAGETANFYPLLFDGKTLGTGQKIPKLIGNDNAQWEIHRGSTGSVSKFDASSYTYSNTVANVFDTIIVTYPASVRLLSDSLYPQKKLFLGTQTIIVKWTPGSETMLRILNADNPFTGSHITDTLSMPIGLDTVRAYAFLFDQYGNYLFNNAASMTNSITWLTVPDSLYVPEVPTHTGTIVRVDSITPARTAIYTIIAALPESTYLGDRYSPKPSRMDTVYVRVGSFSYDSMKILTNSNPHDFFTTTRDTIDGNNALVTSYDTIMLRSCEDTARFIASVHNTESGWQNVPVSWTYNGDTINNALITPRAGSPLSFLTATYISRNTLKDTIYFEIGDEYLDRLFLTPSTRRIVVSVNTSSLKPDTSLDFAAHARSNCGGAIDSTVLWSAIGFNNSVWFDSLNFYLSTGQDSKLLQLGYFTNAKFNQNDSGWIQIRKYDPILRDTLRDSLKLIIIDTTDYDSVKAMVIVPDSAYRNAANPNTLYNLYYNRSIDSKYAGDTLKLAALLFDFKKSGDVLLGAGETPGNDARVYWYLNGSQTVDSIFSYHRNLPRLDTLVIVYKNNDGDTLSTKTFYINWGYGKYRYLRIESAKGTPGNTTIRNVDTLVFGLAKTTDTVYSVIRDELNNFISNDTLKWAMKPSPDYITYLDVPNPLIPISNGWIYKKKNPADEYGYTFYVTLERGVNISGVTIPTEQKDSIHVILVSYSFDQLTISADDSIVTTDDPPYTILPDEEIPVNRTIFLTALQDTIRVKAKLHRDDNSTTPWMYQPVDWRLTNTSCVASGAFTKSINATLMPISSIGIDTLIASYKVSDALTLFDTLVFTVDVPWVSSIRVVPGNTHIIAGDTFHFTIELLDKNGNIVTNPNRIPGNLTLTTNTDMLYLGNNYSHWINSTSYIVGSPFDSGKSTNAVVNYTASNNNSMIIEVTYMTANGPTTFLDTITLNVEPAAPDSMVVIQKTKERPATIDTLTAYEMDLSKTSTNYRVDIYDIYGNLVPTGDSAVYAPIKDNITITGGVLDQKFVVLGYNQISYRASGNEIGGIATIQVAYPRMGLDTLKYSFYIVVIPIIKVLSISTHEWTADPVTNRQNVEYVMLHALNINTAKILDGHSSSIDTISKIYLDTLAHYGFKPYKDGFLDYLDITLSEPFYLSENLINRISFDTVIAGKPDSIVWKLKDSLRTIRLQPVDTIRNDSNHYKWRLWLIPHTLDVGYSSTLETGLLPVITFDNEAIKARDSGLVLPRIGSSASLYTTPIIRTVDSAAPVIMKFMFSNNACNPNNPENSVQIGFSEPVRFTGFPNHVDVKGLVLLNPQQPADSTFMANAIISGKYKDRVFNPVTAWNYNTEPDRLMTYELIIKPEYNKLFKANETRIRFADLNPAQFEFLDLNNNAGTTGPNRTATLANDPTVAPNICGVNGNTLVSNTASMNFSWGEEETTVNGADRTGPVPLFPYFGVTINLSSITGNNVERNTPMRPIVNVGGRCFVVCDYDNAYPLFTTEITIFDLLGNLVAGPSTNKSLKGSYAIAQIRKYLDMDELENRISSMTLDEIENHFSISGNGLQCDTLRPLYPTTVTFGYDYMNKNCGPESAGSMDNGQCVASWNCLNAKGRLVAPGGYIAHQYIRSGYENTDVTRKIIVTNKDRR